MLEFLGSDATTTGVWSLVSRGIALVYLVSFCSLWGQVLGLAGKDGVTPVALVLDRYRRDYPSLWQRLLYLPTLLWISSGDRMLRALVALGFVAALAHAQSARAARSFAPTSWMRGVPGFADLSEFWAAQLEGVAPEVVPVVWREANAGRWGLSLQSAPLAYSSLKAN